MALAIDSQMPSSVGDGIASPTSPRTVAFTNTAGTVLYVWVGAATDPNSGAAVALTSVTYGGTAMTLVKSQASDTANNRGKLFLYRLLNPPTGSNNIVVSWSVTLKDIEIGAISFTGNDSVTPEKQTAVNHGSGTSATAALTGVTAGNISIACAGAGSAFSAQTQTLDWAKNVDNNTYMGNARASTSTASGAVTHGFTLASDAWGAIVCEVAAASGGSGGSASGSLPTDTMSAPAGTATGGASTSGSPGTISMSGPSGVATGGATCSGALSTVTLSAPTGSAVGGAGGALPTVALSAASASATGDALAAGSIPALALSSVAGAATGDGAATCSLVVVTLAAPAASATGDGSTSGALTTCSMVAPAGSAAGTGSDGNAFGSLPTIGGGTGTSSRPRAYTPTKSGFYL